MALILGEYKYSEEMTSGRKVWIKHMPDAPLFVEAKAWTRIIKVFGRQLEAKDADIAAKPRVVICALVFAKREHTYQIDTASFMLTTNQWIPVSGVEEIDLIEALIAQKRRFLKPLQYDAKYAAAFPNVLLLDGGDEPVALHVTSNFMTELERSTKDKLLKSAENGQWVWNTGDAMPHFPKAAWPAAASVRPAIGVPDDFRLLPPS
jgi:hypothetical protein